MKQIIQSPFYPKKRIFSLCLLVSTGAILGGCAQSPSETSIGLSVGTQNNVKDQISKGAESTVDVNDPGINDPLEPLNRGIYIINMGIDGIVLKPLALLYRLILPEPVRDSVGHFYVNIHSPITFANHLLQGQPGRAGDTF